MQYQRTDSTTMSDKYTRPRQFIPVSVIISTSGSLHPHPLSLTMRRMSSSGNRDLWECQRYFTEISEQNEVTCEKVYNGKATLMSWWTIWFGYVILFLRVGYGSFISLILHEMKVRYSLKGGYTIFTYQIRLSKGDIDISFHILINTENN